MAAIKIDINLRNEAIPNRPDNYLCYLATLCPYVKTPKLDVNMEVQIVAMYYGM